MIQRKLLLPCLLLLVCQPVMAERILFVTSSVSSFNDADNGTFLMELAIPLDTLDQLGHQIDIVSPNGGQIPIYDKPELHDEATNRQLNRIRQSELFVQKISQTLTPAQVDPTRYAAVIIPGGYAQFQDLHSNIDIARIITTIYQSGGVIGTLGHGTSTLVHLRLDDNSYLVKDKTMTSFPSWNEQHIMQDSNYGALLPFDMEAALIEHGAHLKVYDSKARQNHEIIDEDNRLVTASFASSGAFVAHAVDRLIAAKDDELDAPDIDFLPRSDDASCPDSDGD